MININSFIIEILESIMLVTALSTDAFVACFGYGTNKIKIPFLSVTIINVVCSSILAISLFLGSIIRPFIPDQLTKWICFSILMVLGITKLFDSTLKSIIKKRKELHKKLSFSFLSLNFILQVYAEPEAADTDASKTLSPLEAMSLSIALSLDGLAIGFGAALSNINCVQVVAFSLISDMVAVMLGCYFGNKIAEKTSVNLSWLSGALLIILAALKL